MGLDIFFVIFVKLILIGATLVLFIWKCQSDAGSVYEDIWNRYKFATYLIPIVYTGINIILILIVESSYWWMGALPLLIPTSDLLYRRLINRSKANTYKRFEKFCRVILSIIQHAGIDMEIEDVRIHVKNRKEVDYYLTVYQGQDMVTMKIIEKNLHQQIKKHFPNHQIRIFTDFSKNRRRQP